MPNQHERLHRRHGAHQNDKKDAVVKTVYKTMEPTFKGGVAGYTTVKKEDPKPTQAKKEDDPKTTVQAPKKEVPTTAIAKKLETTEESKPKPTTASNDDKDKAKDGDSKTQAKATSTIKKTSAVPTVIHVPTDTESVESVLAKATGDVAHTSALKGAAPSDLTTAPALASASASATADASISKSETEGTSPGAKAGIAFGVLGGLFLVGMLVFLAFNRRRKRAQHEKLANDDEKLNGPIGGGGGVFPADNMSVRTDPKAPRISLRPVTQFLPNWNMNDKRASKGAAMTLSPAAAAASGGHATTSRAPGGSAWDRPTTSQSIDPANPFGTQAERVPTPIQEESVHTRSTPPSPVSERSLHNDPLTANGPPVSGAVAAGAGAAALTRKTSMRKGGPQQLDLTLPNPPLGPVPPSPAGTEFSVSSANPGAPAAQSSGAAAIAAAGGPANSAVHRVQLDFKPTLEDELGLKAGDLVRLLHEYDDGWALVIRLDRSKQGVVPRTCLSTRPVKPRPAQGGPRPGPPVKPAGPPRGPGPNHSQGQRPTTPQGRPMTPQGRPMTPNGGRSQSPMGRPMPAGHPGGRSMSPGPRSQSPAPRNGPPAGRPMSPGPRSMSPGPRSQSPGPRQGPPQGPPSGRPQSPSNMNRRNSPPGPSPMNPAQGPPTGPVGRKPVPGQAY